MSSNTTRQNMTECTNFTGAELRQMLAWQRAGQTDREIWTGLLCLPAPQPRQTRPSSRPQPGGHSRHLGEISSELYFLKRAPNPAVWTREMEEEVVHRYRQGYDSNDITSKLFNRFAKPAHWQETYKMVQKLKMEGRIA